MKIKSRARIMNRASGITGLHLYVEVQKNGRHYASSDIDVTRPGRNMIVAGPGVSAYRLLLPIAGVFRRWTSDFVAELT